MQSRSYPIVPSMANSFGVEVLRHTLRRDRFGPFAGSFWSFTSPHLAQGHPELVFLPLVAHQVVPPTRLILPFGLQPPGRPTTPPADFCCTVRVNRSTLRSDPGTCNRLPEVSSTAFSAQPPNYNQHRLRSVSAIRSGSCLNRRSPVTLAKRHNNMLALAAPAPTLATANGFAADIRLIHFQDPAHLGKRAVARSHCLANAAQIPRGPVGTDPQVFLKLTDAHSLFASRTSAVARNHLCGRWESAKIVSLVAENRCLQVDSKHC